MNFLVEIWIGYRAYVIKLVQNFLVAASLWLGLFAFKALTYVLPVSDWAGQFIVHVHSVGIVAAFIIFGYLSVNDIIHRHRGGMVCLFV